MTKFYSFIAPITLAFSGLVLTNQPPTNVLNQAQATNTQEVSIRFQSMVGSQPFSCNESYMLGTPASRVAPLDFRFYVSDVALIDEKGNAVPLMLKQDGRWQYKTVALLDFENKSGKCANGTVETNDRLVGTVPARKYKGLKFTVGVPSNLNHADATLAPSPLNLTSLWWNWQFGYKFARIDLSNQNQKGLIPTRSKHQENSTHEHGDERNIGFAIHLGSTGCEMAKNVQSPASCSNANTSTITLSKFVPNQNVVVADLAALLAKTNLSTNQPKTAPGCMSEPKDSDCVGIMAALGIPFNNTPSANQTFFRLK